MSNKTADLSVTIPGMSRRGTDQPACISSPFAQKERVRCMFCGGDQCNRCGINAHQRLEKPAIPNLHSSWINESILAMQRPSDILFDQHNVLESFQRANITAVFNLTEPGEHPYCGTGVLPHSGFPYSPEKLMKAGSKDQFAFVNESLVVYLPSFDRRLVKHFNFNWPDMTAPTVAVMMEIAYIGAAEINRGGKIAVHCHAGFGRTGMAIACILIFKDQVESAQVITFIRNRRPGSIQTAAQERFINKFEKSFRFLMQSFPTRDSLELSNSGDNTTISTARSATQLGSALTQGAATLSRGFSSPASPPSNALTTITENTNTTLYLKTLKQSIQDQHYLLTPIEQTTRMFHCVHKLVHFTTAAITALCKDYVILAHLGITGLNKLVPRENTSHKFTSNLSKHNMTVLMNAPSYMVATNSMSQGLEETILTDIKFELNTNKWTRFMSVADVVAISLNFGQESVRRLTKVTSTVAEEKSPNASFRPGASNGALLPPIDSPVSTSSHGNAGGTGSARPVIRSQPSMYRNNSLKEVSNADYDKSKRVSANIMSQLLIDWLETRQNCVFDVAFSAELQELWYKHYPKFGELGCATQAWIELRTRTRAYLAFEAELLQLLRKLDRYRQHVLGNVVAMYHAVHAAGCDANNEDGQNEAPMMDTMVALRLSIALMHCRKQQHMLVRNRALNMELVKLFMLKHADVEPVIINNITFTSSQAEPIAAQLGASLVTTLEVLVRTLLVLQEVEWAPEASLEDRVHWRGDTVQKFEPS